MALSKCPILGLVVLYGFVVSSSCILQPSSGGGVYSSTTTTTTPPSPVAPVGDKTGSTTRTPPSHFPHPPPRRSLYPQGLKKGEGVAVNKDNGKGPGRPVVRIVSPGSIPPPASFIKNRHGQEKRMPWQPFPRPHPQSPPPKPKIFQNMANFIHSMMDNTQSPPRNTTTPMPTPEMTTTLPHGNKTEAPFTTTSKKPVSQDFQIAADSESTTLLPLNESVPQVSPSLAEAEESLMTTPTTTASPKGTLDTTTTTTPSSTQMQSPLLLLLHNRIGDKDERVKMERLSPECVQYSLRLSPEESDAIIGQTPGVGNITASAITSTACVYPSGTLGASPPQATEEEESSTMVMDNINKIDIRSV